MSDSSVLSPGTQAIRLVGGPTPAEGRVELYYNGSYGTICQTGWTIEDANVVCRSLGYAAALVAMGGAAYGSGTGQVCGEVEYAGACVHVNKEQYIHCHLHTSSYTLSHTSFPP